MNRPCRRRFVSIEDGKPVLSEDETVYMVFPNISIAFKSEGAPEVGTLHVTTRRFIWIGEREAHDFDVAYITLHAVTHDPSSYPQPCLYCQLDEEDEEEEQEVYFIPQDDATLESLFQAFSHAAMLNPDTNEDMVDGDEMADSTLIYNVDEVELGAEQARRLAQFEAAFVDPSDHENGGHAEDGDSEKPHKMPRREE